MTTEPAIDIVARGDRLRSIEASLADFTDAEKLELIGRIARSIRSGPAEPDEQARRQYENRVRLLEELAALPTAPNDDGFSNRDHDKILYGTSS